MRKPDNKERDLFIQYGSAASEAMLDFPCHFFQTPNNAGFIPYRLENHCAVVFGDPVCPPHEKIELDQAFRKYCNESHFNIIYITTSEAFFKLLQEAYPISIQVCEELIFDPQLNPLFESHRLQRRVNKAIKHGLTFHEYLPVDKELEETLLNIGLKWQQSKKGMSVYLGHLNFFEDYEGKRWFYVKDHEKITAMAMLCQMNSHNGWLLKFFTTLPESFPETSEFLMISLLKKLKEENCHFLSKGMVPTNNLEIVKGFKFSSPIVKFIYKCMSFVFKFKKRKEYWERYFPKKEPSYVLLSTPKMTLNQIKALIKVFRINH